MSHTMSNLVSLLAVSLISTGFLTSCLPTPANRAPGGGSGNSILTEIDGIDKNDIAIAGIQFILHCDSAAGVAKDPVTSDKVNSADNTVKFNGDKVTDGDSCALEVRIPPPTGAEAALYKWHSKPDDKSIGLLYGSSRSKVADRKLSLTLYTLYTRQAGPEFPATFEVSYELAAGTSAPVTPTASLTCANNKSYPTTEYKSTAATEGTFTFKLPVADLKGVACSTLTILEATTATYEATLDAAVYKFDEPKKDTVYPFATRIKLLPKTAGSVTTTIAAGKCVNYDAVKLNCLDRRSVTLPRAKNFWAAKIETRVKANEVSTFYVAPGTPGNLLDSTGAEKNVTEINKTLIKAASDADKKLFSWFNAAIYPDFMSFEWNRVLPANDVFTKNSATRAQVEDMEFSHIAAMYIHGFKEVTEQVLNSSSKARWFALVKATSGTTVSEFIVAGTEEYFSSATRPAADKFFSWDAVKADRDAKTNKYKVYAIKGGAMAPAACAAEKSYYIDDLSTKYSDEMKAATARNTTIDACLVAQDKFVKDFDAATIAPTLYLWGWHEVK